MTDEDSKIFPPKGQIWEIRDLTEQQVRDALTKKQFRQFQEEIEKHKKKSTILAAHTCDLMIAPCGKPAHDYWELQDSDGSVFISGWCCSEHYAEALEDHKVFLKQVEITTQRLTIWRKT